MYFDCQVKADVVEKTIGYQMCKDYADVLQISWNKIVIVDDLLKSQVFLYLIMGLGD